MALPGAPTVTGCRVPGRWATDATASRGSTLTSVTHSSWSRSEEAGCFEVVCRGRQLGQGFRLQIVRDAGGKRCHPRAESHAPGAVAGHEPVVFEGAYESVGDRAVHAEMAGDLVH